MDDRGKCDITARLRAWRDGDASALDGAMRDLYPLLRDIASQRLRREHGPTTLDPTDLVNEALARMLGGVREINDRRHFLAVAALHMRSILTDRARAIRIGRRAEPGVTITIGGALGLGHDGGLDLLALDDALRALEAEDPRASRLFSLQCFSGPPREDIAEIMAMSLATVDRDLRFARAWINQALG